RLVDKSTGELLRAVNELKHGTLRGLGRNWADWDTETRPDKIAGTQHSVHPYRVYMDGLRSPFNVGSVLRTSLAFGFEQVWASPDCAPPDHARSVRSSMGAVDRVPWKKLEIEEIDETEMGRLFALEVGGTPIEEFPFPESGTVVLGSEELGVSPEILKRAESEGGVVSIPLPGPKTSLNVGVAFGILAHGWNSRCSSSGEDFFQSPVY
ncbi:MAG: TrmH family RNA methyltransferase, partial [Spirochaetaceae bacterium]|nr:TrmH family RNA methyltransferase [Spirochaetaceae bacterium]